LPTLQPRPPLGAGWAASSWEVEVTDELFARRLKLDGHHANSVDVVNRAAA
jgi:hypothetical protein